MIAVTWLPASLSGDEVPDLLIEVTSHSCQALAVVTLKGFPSAWPARVLWLLRFLSPFCHLHSDCGVCWWPDRHVRKGEHQWWPCWPGLHCDIPYSHLMGSRRWMAAPLHAAFSCSQTGILVFLEGPFAANCAKLPQMRAKNGKVLIWLNFRSPRGLCLWLYLGCNRHGNGRGCKDCSKCSLKPLNNAHKLFPFTLQPTRRWPRLSPLLLRFMGGSRFPHGFLSLFCCLYCP